MSSEPLPATVGHVLRVARDAMNLSSPEVARAAGISKAQLSNIENGYQVRDGERTPVHPRAATIASVADVVRVTPAELTRAGRDDAAEVLAERLRRAAPESAAGNPAPDGAPACTFERSVLRESGLSPEGQAQMIRAHRLSGHTFCHGLAERGEAPQTALSAS